MLLAGFQCADLAGLGGLRLVYGILDSGLVLLGLGQRLGHRCGLGLLGLLLNLLRDLALGLLSLGVGHCGLGGGLSGLRLSGRLSLFNGLGLGLLVCSLLGGLANDAKAALAILRFR